MNRPNYEKSAALAGWEFFGAIGGGHWMSPDDNNVTTATAKEACDRFGVPLEYDELFDFTGLSPLQKGRVDAALAKQFRYSDGIRTLGADMKARFDRGELTHKKESDGMIDYNRRRFNQMNYREQDAYMAKLKAKRYFWAEDAEGVGHAVPKIVFDVLALPVKESKL